MRSEELNERFNNLPNERQLKIINGALDVFGKYEYKKATMEEIAKSAGISKSLLFHYFNSKKELFIDIYSHGIEVMQSELKEANLENETDFFDLMRKSIKKKLEVMKQYPSLTDFLIHAYYETHKDVVNEITGINASIKSETIFSYFNNIDLSKFRDDISLEMAINTILWISDGYLNNRKTTILNANDIYLEFSKYIDLYERLFYKGEE